MSLISREVIEPRKVKLITCDFVSRESKLEELTYKPCKNEAPFESIPHSWATVTLDLKFHNVVGLSSTTKIFHFCPEHAEKAEERLARVLAP